MKLSVILITKNEAARLPRCLESVRGLADEIVILDSGSTDATLEIARRHTDKVYSSPDWPGFGPQKNRALDHATGDWVLSLDADEWLTPELAAEIRQTLQAPTAAVYEIPRLSSFCGRPMRHSGWWPDHVARLFRRGAARFSDDLVHERLVFDGQAVALRGILHHESFRSLEEVLNKANAYSSQGAQQAFVRGRSGSLGKAIAHAAWTFIRTYWLRRGFMDGREGLMLAISNAEGVYYRYLKLMYLAERKKR
jgi:glycosyltransferase involved in cell wall biosynthesis